MKTPDYISPRDTLRAEIRARLTKAERQHDHRTVGVCELALWAMCDAYLSMGEVEALRQVKAYRALDSSNPPNPT